MTTLTATEIEEIKERLAKATPGPWEHVIVADDIAANIGNGNRIPPHVRATTRDEQNRRVTRFLCHCNSANTPNEENAILIAAAPTDIARLLETVEAQQAEIERLRAALEPFKASFKHLMSVERGPTHVDLPLSVTQSMLCIGDLLNAAAALEKKEPDPKTGQS